MPSLPIITPPEPARSDREKYGTLFLLSIAGLLVLLAFVFFRRAGRGIDAAQGWFERWLTEWASGKEGEASS